MNSLNLQNKPTLNFYSRNVITVAKDLLGKIFVKIIEGKILAGIIVETEAYDGSMDKAAHSFNGKTKRNEVMFERGGLLYVYFTYGVHHCCNVVTGKPGEGCAVLIRAIEPISGINQMAINRFGRPDFTPKDLFNLTSGPGKICKAFSIDRRDNGANLMGDEIFIIDGAKIPKNKIVVSSRIGIKKSADLPWRFYIKDNQFVSSK